MTQLRIDARNLAAELDSALARLNQGDEVLLERDGEVVAQLAPCTHQEGVRGPGNILRFIEERRKAEPLDDETIEAIMEAVAYGNRPAELPQWDR